MESNLRMIEGVIDYIEEHLMEEKLDLDSISVQAGYSKYHLHRMFTSIVGAGMHQYILRRRLTESARKLITSKETILEIALDAGYETQRSFTKAFQTLFGSTPNAYRKGGRFLPLQLKYEITNRNTFRGDWILNVSEMERETTFLAGYHGNTSEGFGIVGHLFQKLQENQSRITNRCESRYTIGLNDYSSWIQNEEIPEFDVYAGVPVAKADKLPQGMTSTIIDKGYYVVFYYSANRKESLQPVIEYIYQEWFPNSTCIFDETRTYDFVCYGVDVDRQGKSEIQVWVPIRRK